jgi:hypothetical protein
MAGSAPTMRVSKQVWASMGGSPWRPGFLPGLPGGPRRRYPIGSNSIKGVRNVSNYLLLTLAVDLLDHTLQWPPNRLAHAVKPCSSQPPDTIGNRSKGTESGRGADRLSGEASGVHPDYRERRRAGLWIASTRVEKFNDWAVSGRCKDRGMSWSSFGVLALAALEVARRDGELNNWRMQHKLPDRTLPKPAQKAA